MRTYTPKPGDVERNWYVIDATDVVLGRLATHVATLLRGKHKATFAPHVDGGDFVIVINAEKIALTGNKRENKLAYRHSGYPGGLRAGVRNRAQLGRQWNCGWCRNAVRRRRFADGSPAGADPSARSG